MKRKRIRIPLLDASIPAPAPSYVRPSVICSQCGRVIRSGESFSLSAGVYHSAVPTITGRHFPDCDSKTKQPKLAA